MVSCGVKHASARWASKCWHRHEPRWFWTAQAVRGMPPHRLSPMQVWPTTGTRMQLTAGLVRLGLHSWAWAPGSLHRAPCLYTTSILRSLFLHSRRAVLRVFPSPRCFFGFRCSRQSRTRTLIGANQRFRAVPCMPHPRAVGSVIQAHHQAVVLHHWRWLASCVRGVALEHRTRV